MKAKALKDDIVEGKELVTAWLRSPEPNPNAESTGFISIRAASVLVTDYVQKVVTFGLLDQG